MSEEKFENHYGVWVNNQEPVTGVMSIHNIAWEFVDYPICLDCEQWINEIEKMTECPECGENIVDDECPKCEWDRQRELDFIECDSSHDKIFGDAWYFNEQSGLYEIDETKEFAAIERESVVQIVWSKHLAKNKLLCSPCFPGQIDLDSDDGEYCGYTLPEDLLRKDDE